MDTQLLLVRRDGRQVVVHHLLTSVWPALDRTTVADVDLSHLPDGDRERLQRGAPAWGESGADARLAVLRADARSCEGSLVPPCPGQTLNVPIFLVAPQGYPHGNRVKLTWTDPDLRAGATTSLKFLTHVAASATDCPAVITRAGSCEATVGFGTKVVAGLTVTAPRSTSRTLQSASSALAKPKITIKVGKIFISSNHHIRACSLDVSVRGYQRFTVVKVFYTDADRPDTNWVRVTTDDRGDADFNTVDDYQHGWGGYGPGRYTLAARAGSLKGVNSRWTCRP